MQLDRKDLVAATTLTAAWTLTALFIGVDGEFPVSDDWAYARTTLGLIETGEFERVGWTWAPIITNVAIGAAFASILGSTFEALRTSTVVMGWVGLMGCFVLCRQLGASARASAGGALLYGWNPIHLVLSFTFMTDVAFAAFCTWSLVCLQRGLPRLRWPWIIAGLACAMIATLSRQLGLALPVAAAIASVVAFAPRPRSVIVIGAGVVAACALFVLVPSLFYGAGDANQMFGFEEYLGDLVLRPYAMRHVVLNSILAIIYVGGFVAPLAFLSIGSSAKPTQDVVAGFLACGLAVAFVALRGWQMPPGIDWIYDLGLGPLNLIGESERPHLGPSPWMVIVLITSFAGGAALLTLARATRDTWSDPRERVVTLLLLAYPAVYFAVSAVRHPYFDRYLIPILPPLIALLVPAAAAPLRRRAPACVAAVAAATVLVFAVLGTRDYFEFNRTRAALLDDLLGQGVSARAIDGGSEFNGWHHYDPNHALFLKDARNLWVVDDEFVLALVHDVPGYHEVGQRRFERLLPPTVEVVTIQHRDSPADHRDPKIDRVNGD